MKTFRLLGMALLAVVMCVNFASCSSDDDEEENNGGSTAVSGKLLLKMTGYWSDNTLQFSYNEKRQLTSVSITPRENNFNTETRLDIEWLNSKVLVKTSDRSFEEEAYLTIDKGIVTRADVREDGGDFWTNTLTYDKDNHLIKTNDGESWSWENGNVVKFTRYDNYGVKIKSSTFTYYTDKENKHPVMDIDWVDFSYAVPSEMGDLLFLVYPKLLGTPNKNLLKSVTTVYDGGKPTQTTNFTYEFDSDGYPIKVILNGNNNHYYTMIWD